VSELELKVRAATRADIPGLLAFWADSAENDDRPADTAEAVERVIRRDPEALLVVLDEDRIVGSLIVGWDGWRCHLYRLAVAPGYRRRGIGQALLDAAHRRGSAHGASRIDAMVLDSNGPAKRLWASAGYDRQERWARWIKPLEPPSGHSDP
jgi:ribosomal protein S18 acetylase RimI-like enzyme